MKINRLSTRLTSVTKIRWGIYASIKEKIGDYKDVKSSSKRWARKMTSFLIMPTISVVGLCRHVGEESI